MELSPLYLQELVTRALEEDLGAGDITTGCLIPEGTRGVAAIIAKCTGVIAGLELARLVFRTLDPAIEFSIIKPDGSEIETGQVIARLSGAARGILMGERTALNFLQHLSGVATKTARFAKMIAFYNARIVDTRKTVPGLRHLQKYAVRVGGGSNHRFGLYDAVLIKDNHIALAGGIKKAVTLARRGIPHTMKIEVEVEDLEQLAEAVEARADIIMLDNMDTDTMREAVKIANGQALLEASGGINEETLVEVAKTGVDLISIGVLTRSVEALDISLDVVITPEG